MGFSPGDQADLLAKEAASSKASFPTIFKQDLLPLPASLLRQSQTEFWNSATAGNTYRLTRTTLGRTLKSSLRIPYRQVTLTTMSNYKENWCANTFPYEEGALR